MGEGRDKRPFAPDFWRGVGMIFALFPQFEAQEGGIKAELRSFDRPFRVKWGRQVVAVLRWLGGGR